MDILQELPYSQWPKLQEKLKTFWPYNLPGYYALYLNMKYSGVREAFQFKVYCPYGEINHGFIATSIKVFTLFGSEACVCQRKHESKVNAEEMRSLRKRCGVTLANRIRYEEIRRKKGLKDSVIFKMDKGMLSWFGHVERMEDERQAHTYKLWSQIMIPGSRPSPLIAGNLDCIVFSISKDTSMLEEALLNTKLIDWNECVIFDLVSSVTLSCLKKINLVMKFRHYDLGLANMYLFDRNAEPFENVRYPSDTYLAAVNQNKIQRVDDTWPYRHPASYFYFTTLASEGLSYGLYSSVTNELLAWIFLNEYNFLCHLYCEENHRMQGYAEFLVKSVVNYLLRRGCDAYAYVVEGNEKPSKLFSKLGFKVADDSAYLYVQK